MCQNVRRILAITLETESQSEIQNRKTRAKAEGVARPKRTIFMGNSGSEEKRRARKAKEIHNSRELQSNPIIILTSNNNNNMNLHNYVNNCNTIFHNKHS